MAEGGKPDRTLAVLLIVVGVLMLALSGTCSAGFLVSGGFWIRGPVGAPPPPIWDRFVLPILVFGAPFIVLGSATMLVGIRLRNRGGGIGAKIVGAIYFGIGALGALYFGAVVLVQPSVVLVFVAAFFAAIGWLGWRTGRGPRAKGRRELAYVAGFFIFAGLLVSALAGTCTVHYSLANLHTARGLYQGPAFIHLGVWGGA